jgi:osmotically inducible protein OsmC
MEDLLERTASAEWQGTLREGKGTMTAPSGVLRETPYTFATRFETAPGTNPEELLGAAHAGCFSMAFSGKLAAAGMTPERIRTTATVTLEKTDAGMTVTRIHLDTRVKAGGATPEKVRAAAEDARATCPISRLLRAEISVTAALE